MVMITAKLANMRWRNVQFFTVSPRGHSNAGEYSRGRATNNQRLRTASHPGRKPLNAPGQLLSARQAAGCQ
ncbi:hypothetical protein D3C78_773320 [compost metagenome]